MSQDAERATVVIHSARLVSGGTLVPDAWVQLRGGTGARGSSGARGSTGGASGGTGARGSTVVRVGTGAGWRGLDDLGAAAVVDAVAVAGPDAVLTPGFVDIHGHGGGGFSYEGDEDGIRAARAVHRAHGTTRAVLSLVSGSLEHLCAQVARVAALTRTDPDILGSHLEGPFLDHAHRGAHDPRALALPTPAAVDALLDAGAGTIRQITLAPELDGGMDAVRAFADAGVAVAVGHTDADFAATGRAIDAGARILTHAFNAMPPLHHRMPGPVAAATADPRMIIEVIADGVHVHPELVRMLFAAAPGRVTLITDAMAAAGAGDGRYLLGDLAVDVTDGVARLVDGGAIAGSTLTQDAALRTAVAAGVTLIDAVDALTVVPARAIGRPDLGILAPGHAADAVLLDADLTVRAVWCDGTRA